MILGYSRISKGDDQNSSMQLQAMQNAKVDKIFEETASGGRWDRPILHRMLEQLREGDTVVVWKLDRLSRSLKDLLAIILKNAVENSARGFLLVPRFWWKSLYS